MNTQNISNIEHFQKVLTQAEHAKGRSDILIDKAISILFCRSSGCVSLSTYTDRRIWIAVSAPERYHNHKVMLLFYNNDKEH